MKPDLYTKIALTVIAVCLTVLTLKQTDLVQSATAAGTAMTMSDNIRVNSDGSINVRIVMPAFGSLPVEVKNQVKIESPYGGLPVEVKNSYIHTKPY